jgi:N4-(beta-N-acetylglucosaminyl)-L-asparaginase
MPLDRRTFLVASAAAVAATTTAARSFAQLGQGSQGMKAISSANGLKAVERACELMSGNADTLDAAIAGVEIVEDDPDDVTVGYGGLPNENGVVELDAAVMHGPTHKGGAVASLQNIRHPAAVARLVMKRTDHVLLVGEGALQFAKAHGFREENLLTDKARKIWLYWKESLSGSDDWLPPAYEDIDPDVRRFFKIKPTENPPGPKTSQRHRWNYDRPTGTIHLAARNAAGDVSCVTTTSGLAFKLPGRVGDSPIIGAGLYCDNAIGSCGSTGRGEANLQNLSSFAGVELMRSGKSPKDAGLEVLRRVAATTEPRLKNSDGRPDYDLKLYLLAKDGRHAGVSIWGPAKFAVCDENGPRLEECAALFERDKTA